MSAHDRLRWWVDLWRRREAPHSMALVRMALATVLLVDLLQMRWLGLVRPLMGARAAGGLGAAERLERLPWIVQWVGNGDALHETFWWGMTLGCVALLLGVMPRIAALVVVLLYAQLALVLPAADRGIDLMLRNGLFILAFVPSAATWSVSCRLRHGRWGAPAATVIPAWSRYLLCLQLVVVYFAAGVSKVSSSWTPLGGLSALFLSMSDPHLQRVPDDWLRAGYALTQVGTLGSVTWEWLAPVLLLAWWYRETADRPGRLRAWMNERPVVATYLWMGVFFHLGTHLFLRLGIFPFGMLAFYPACISPDRWGCWLGGLKR